MIRRVEALIARASEGTEGDDEVERYLEASTEQNCRDRTCPCILVWDHAA